MESLFSSKKSPFDVERSEVAIAITPAESDYHSGLFFVNEHDEATVLHFAFHSDLRSESLENCLIAWWWAEPRILPERAKAISALCNLVWKRYGRNGLPYAFKYLNGCFHTGSGIFDLGPNCNGLTCSTFVLAMFLSCRIKLIKEEEWLQRDGDKARQEAIVAILRKKHQEKKCSEEHLKTVENEIGCVRFSPLDVMAAAIWCVPPIGFNDAVENGKMIDQKIKTDSL
jgi:hypothetical protein